MKRDARLRRLSSDIHHALVLARELSRHVASHAADTPVVHDLRGRFDRELEPHFRVEETILLPRPPGARRVPHALAARIEADHSALRAHLAAAERGDAGRPGPLHSALVEHVRFEERELFPRCEALLPGAVLDAVDGASAPRPLLAGDLRRRRLDALRRSAEGAAGRSNGRDDPRRAARPPRVPLDPVGAGGAGRPSTPGSPRRRSTTRPLESVRSEGCCPLLRRAGDGQALAIACDMPFVSRELITRLAGAITEAPAIAPRRNGRWEPMFARYDARRALPGRGSRRGGSALGPGVARRARASELMLSTDERQELLDDWDAPEDAWSDDEAEGSR